MFFVCDVFLWATAPWCKSSILGDLLKMTSVPLKTELKKTKIALTDSRESSLKTDDEERISPAEEVRTYEKGVELRKSVLREEYTLKREIKQQLVLAKDEDEVSSWYSEDQRVEPVDIEPACREYEDAGRSGIQKIIIFTYFFNILLHLFYK